MEVTRNYGIDILLSTTYILYYEI